MNIINTILLVLAYTLGAVFLLGALFVFYNIFRDPNKVKQKKPNKAEKVQIAEAEEAANTSFFRSHNIDLGINSENNDVSRFPVRQVRAADIENPELRPARTQPAKPAFPQNDSNNGNREQNKPKSRFDFPI